MRKTYQLIHSQQGSVMLAALMVFLVLSVLGASVISVAGMEAKMAVNDARTEQARQAADSGVQIARDIVMNYLMAGNSVPIIMPLNIADNIAANVTVSPADSDGIITISSQGMVTAPNGDVVARKTAEAGIRVNTLPNYPVSTDKVKAMGKYYTVMDWLPSNWGWKEGDDWYKRLYLPVNGPQHTGTANPDNRNPQHYTWWNDFGLNLAGYPEVQHRHIAPYYVPQGKVNIIDEKGNPAEVAVNNWVNTMSPGDENELFYNHDVRSESIKKLGELVNISTHLPDKVLSSQDFLGLHTPVTNSRIPQFGAEQLQRYRDLALSHPDEWQYIDVSDSSILHSKGGHKYELLIDEINKSKVFIDWDKEGVLGDTPLDFLVVVDFTTITHNTAPDWISWNWLKNVIKDMRDARDTWFNRLSNEYDNVVIASAASLEVGFDSTAFEMINPDAGIFLVSLHDVHLTVDPEEFNGLSRIMPEGELIKREVRLFSLAGDTLKITSTPKQITYKGVMHAGKDITIMIDYFDESKSTSMDKTVNIVRQPQIINEFPEPWAYIGVAPIVSYRYIN